MSKRCTGCGETKPLDAFPVNRSQKDGRYRLCRPCNAAALKARNASAAYKASRLEYRRANRDAENAQQRRAHAANPQRLRQAQVKYVEQNRDKKNAMNAEYRAHRYATKALLVRYKEAVQAIYSRAQLLSDITGVEHHVDHIVPLRGKGVCGLHVPWNLQCLPALDNIRKSNRAA